MIKYEDILDKIKYFMSKKASGYSMPLMPHYNRIVGNVDTGVYTVITGMPASGSSSFLNLNYVLGVLLQWYNNPDKIQHPMKIFYFTLKSSEAKLIEQLICLYLKLVYNYRIDIPTLNSQANALYDLGENQNILDALEESKHFFEEILNDEVLVIYDNYMTTNAISNVISEYMLSIGYSDDTGSYQLLEEFDNSYVSLIVDSTEDLKADDNKFNIITSKELQSKFNNMVTRLVTMFNINATIIVPIVMPFVRSPRDTEPSQANLGAYARSCDRGVVLYNPLANNNRKFYQEAETFTGSASGVQLMRYWFVVRNTEGIDSSYDRILFLPGTGFMIEHNKNSYVDDVSIVETILMSAEYSPFHHELNS